MEKEINLLLFNNNNVINMERMFEGYSSLKEINLSSFNTNYVSYIKNKFDIYI